MLVHASVVALVGHSVFVLPWMLVHGFSVFDAIGFVVIMSVIGWLQATRAASRKGLSGAASRFYASQIAAFFPVVALAVHAIAWTVIDHGDTGSWLPHSRLHWVAIISPLIALGCFIAFYRFTQRTQYG